MGLGLGLGLDVVDDNLRHRVRADIGAGHNDFALHRLKRVVAAMGQADDRVAQPERRHDLGERRQQRDDPHAALPWRSFRLGWQTANAEK